MAAKGFQERVLIPALREQGLSVREARVVIHAVFGSIKNALGRHESVELPIGSFAVSRNSKERGWRFGTVVIFDKYRVDFLPSAELELAVAAAPPSPPRPERKKKLSELTISAELIVNFIRQNVQPGNWSLFFDELRTGAGPSIPAMFTHARPKPNEIRPLNEAAQVIEECKPKVMPEDSWDHLYACFEWFAYWSQRVIPKAVWQEALQHAKKTLLPRDPIRTLDGR
jgi:nucleoid DNA-binding protein